MAWVRLDDGFASHPKLAALTDREFRLWLRLLCYCAKYRTGGEVGAAARQEVPGLTTRTLERYRELGLLDAPNGRPPVVHDWAVYQPKDPTAAERMQRLRERN